MRKSLLEREQQAAEMRRRSIAPSSSHDVVSSAEAKRISMRDQEWEALEAADEDKVEDADRLKASTHPGTATLTLARSIVLASRYLAKFERNVQDAAKAYLEDFFHDRAQHTAENALRVERWLRDPKRSKPPSPKMRKSPNQKT